MDLPALLLFVPLAVGITWLFYLIFRANLATQPLGKIVSYFVGVLIIVVTVGWLVDNFLPSWVNQRLQNTTTSTEWRQVIDTSTGIVESSFSPGSSSPTVIVADPTPASIIQQPPAVNSGTQQGGSADQPGMSGDTLAPNQYRVQQGDTLTAIATNYGTTVDALMLANGLTSYTIYAGDVLVIPAVPGK